MKKITILFISFLIIANIFAQKSQTEKIADIKTWYKEITSNIKSYTKSTVDNFDESTEGGDITYYKKNGNIQIIEAAYYGETGNMKFKFYFRNNDLFFVFQVTENYSVPIYVETNDRVITKEENRYYFYCNKMIKWLDKDKKEVLLNNSEFISKEEELLKDVIKLKNKQKE